MNQDAINQLDAELTHAGEQTTLSPKMLLLEKHRITPDTQLKPMQFLFRLFGRPCFPRGELVAITGKAKSGKTLVTSMLMACCQVRDVLQLHREPPQPLRPLWYDTEQSDESTQDILCNRIGRMVRAKPTFDIFNVRAIEWKLRRELLAEAVGHCKPDLVIVDGIRDLVNDINDGVLAQEVMEELMQLAALNACCIVCVLHQNKSGEDHNLRGWIGTELMNKAFEVYACEKMLPQRVFKFEQKLTRKYDIEQTLYFDVDGEGLPCTTVQPSGGASASAGQQYANTFPQLSRDYVVFDETNQWGVDIRRLFGDAFAGKAELTGGDLRTEVCRLSNIHSWKFYNQLLEKATGEEVVEKFFTQDGRVLYRLKGQSPVQTSIFSEEEGDTTPF